MCFYERWFVPKVYKTFQMCGKMCFVVTKDLLFLLGALMSGTDLEGRLRKQPLLSCCPRCGDELGRPLGVREHPHPQPGPRPVGWALLQVTGRPGPESGLQEAVQVNGEHSSAWCAVAPPSAPFPLCHRPQEGTHGRNSGCVCLELPETGHRGGDRGKRGSPSSDPGITEGGKMHPLHVLASATPAQRPFLSAGVTPPQRLRCQGGNRRRKPGLRLCTYLALLPCSVRPAWHTSWTSQRSIL